MKASSQNTFTRQASGTAGTMTLRKRKNGDVIISNRRGKSTKPPTANQKKRRKKFKRGVAYSNKVKIDPAKLALYAVAAKDNQSAHILAVRDKLTPPTVDEIFFDEYTGKVGDKITIEADDDFKVVSVSVEIINAVGALVEKGEAVMDEDGIDWIYTTTVANEPFEGSRIIAKKFSAMAVMPRAMRAR